MLISFSQVVDKYKMTFKGAIAAGVHWAEEHNDYLKAGIDKFVYIEPCTDAFDVLVGKFLNNASVTLFKVACGEQEGEFDMYVSKDNQGQSNSLLKPELHIFQHPEVKFNEMETVKVMPMDKLEFDRKDYNLLVMDVQGAEGMVLKGAKETLPFIDYIYTECNRDETYSGNMQIDEMDEFLAEFGFERVETYWPSENWSWGDALYIRKTLL